MNKISKILLIICFIIMSCQKEISEHDLLHRKNPYGFYGLEIDILNFYSLDDIIKKSTKYLNEKVLISGTVIDVCPMRGCWLMLKDSTSEQSIRVKVKDGEIVFPLSAIGKQIDVMGVFTKLNFTKEQAANWKVHLAEEKGLTINPDQVVLKPSDLYEFRIIGEGMKIYDSK